MRFIFRSAANLIFWNGDDPGSQYSQIQIRVRSAEGQNNCKNCSFLYQSRESQKVHLICINQAPRLINTEDLRVFPSADLEKDHSFPISPLN